MTSTVFWQTRALLYLRGCSGAGNLLQSTGPCPVTSVLLRSRRRPTVLPRRPAASHHAACRAPSCCKGACSSSAVASCSTFCHSSSVLRSCPQVPKASRTEKTNKQINKPSHKTTGWCPVTDILPRGRENLKQARAPSREGMGLQGLPRLSSMETKLELMVAHAGDNTGFRATTPALLSPLEATCQHCRSPPLTCSLLQ